MKCRIEVKFDYTVVPIIRLLPDIPDDDVCSADPCTNGLRCLYCNIFIFVNDIVCKVNTVTAGTDIRILPQVYRFTVQGDISKAFA
jgi:hypothetical protein